MMGTTKFQKDSETSSCTAFAGSKRIASGDRQQVARTAKEFLNRHGSAAVLVFDDRTGEVVEIDFRGSVREVVSRIQRSLPAMPSASPELETPRGPGRPRLGVTAREVTLLPRHWEWLAEQPGGASVALRKLVEDARKKNEPKDRERKLRESAYRFMSALAGDLPGFEEATRALFAGDQNRFEQMTEGWPADVRNHARKLAFPV